MVDNEELKKKNQEKVNQHIVEIEYTLGNAIKAFYEAHRMDITREYITEYFLRFCYERKLPMKETLEAVNAVLPNNKKQKYDKVVPSSKRGQRFMTSMVLFPMLNNPEGLSDPKLRKEMVLDFCDTTGFDVKLVEDQIEYDVKQRKTVIIERDAYNHILSARKRFDDKKGREEAEGMIIEAYSEILGMEQSEIIKKLKSKRKREKAEEKRKKQKTVPDDYEGR